MERNAILSSQKSYTRYSEEPETAWRPEKRFMEPYAKEVDIKKSQRYMHQQFDFTVYKQGVSCALLHSPHQILQCLEEEVLRQQPEKDRMLLFLETRLERFPKRLSKKRAPISPPSERYAAFAESVIKELREAVFKERPEEIIKFLVQAVQKRIANKQTTMDRLIGKTELSKLTAQQLSDYVLTIFVEFDEDANGFLDRQEFKKALQGNKLDLTKQQIKNFMAECDDNGDGKIDYHEFLPLMTEVIVSSKAKAEAAKLQEMNIGDAYKQARISLPPCTALTSTLAGIHRTERKGRAMPLSIACCLRSDVALLPAEATTHLV
ncbi:hypothetical protein CYMTET_22520, partial [Cymbomonas tetramitiformis]